MAVSKTQLTKKPTSLLVPIFGMLIDSTHPPDAILATYSLRLVNFFQDFAYFQLLLHMDLVWLAIF